MAASPDDPQFTQNLQKYLSADPNALPIPQRGSLSGVNRAALTTPKSVESAYGQIGKAEEQGAAAQSALKGQIGIGETLQQEALAKGQAGASQTLASRQKDVTSYLDEVHKQFPNEEFHPTKDNVQSLAGLFSLIGVIGASIGGRGKLSSMGALQSMTGMMKGWQQGDVNRWTQEKQQFDEHMANVKNIVDSAEKSAARAMDLAKTDYQAAIALAQETAARLGSQIARYKANNGTVEDFFKYVEGIKKDVDKASGEMFQEKMQSRREGFENQQRLEREAYENQQRLQREEFEKQQAERKKKAEAPLGPNAWFESTIGKKFTNDNTADKAATAIASLSSMDRLLLNTRDPEVITGLGARLTNIKEQLKSANRKDNDELSQEDVNSLITRAVDPADKNAAFLKQALYTAFEAERAAQGGRLTVQMMKLGGSALNPQNYTKEAYLAVLGDRRNAIVSNLRKNGLSDSEITTLTDNLSRQQVPVTGTTPTSTSANIPTKPDDVPAGAKYSPSQKKWWWQDASGKWQSK